MDLIGTITIGDTYPSTYRYFTLAAGSDYSGNVITKTNYDYICRHIKSAWKKNHMIYPFEGGYGSYMILFQEDDDYLSEKAKEFINDILDKFRVEGALDEEGMLILEKKIIYKHLKSEWKYEKSKFGNFKMKDVWNYIYGECLGFTAFTEEGCLPYINFDAIVEKMKERSI